MPTGAPHDSIRGRPRNRPPWVDTRPWFPTERKGTDPEQVLSLLPPVAPKPCKPRELFLHEGQRL